MHGRHGTAVAEGDVVELLRQAGGDARARRSARVRQGGTGVGERKAGLYAQEGARCGSLAPPLASPTRRSAVGRLVAVHDRGGSVLWCHRAAARTSG